MKTESTKIQLLGHATFKVTTPEGKIIIIDPWLLDNPYIPAGLEDQPIIHLMLITHGHEDHLDIRIGEIIAGTTPRIIANNICRRYLMEQNVPEELFEPMNLGGTLRPPWRKSVHSERLPPRPCLCHRKDDCISACNQWLHPPNV